MKIGDIGVMVYVDAVSANIQTAILPGGIVRCECGTAKCPRKDGKAIRNYWKVIFLFATEGYTCPSCGKFYDHVMVSESQLRRWKLKFPDWPWNTIRIWIQ